MREVTELIRNIEHFQALQDDVDYELSNNGGEITKEIELMQTAIDRMQKDLIELGTDNIIQSMSYLAGRVDLLKNMKKDIDNSIKSLDNTIQRIKWNAGTYLAVTDVKDLGGSLGSIKVRDETIVEAIEPELVDDEYKTVTVKYNKVDYDKNEFNLAGLELEELSKKVEVNTTKAKNDRAIGLKISDKKTITIYKKRGSKKDNE